MQRCRNASHLNIQHRNTTMASALQGPKKREIAPEGGFMYSDFMVEIEGG